MPLQNFFALAPLVTRGVLVIAAPVVEDVALGVTEWSSEGKHLFRRGIPDCKQLYGEGFEHEPNKVMLQKARYSLSHPVYYDKDGYREPICDRKQIVCFSLAPYIKWERPKPDPSRIGEDIGFWLGRDHSQLVAAKYWHNELGFSGNGGSAKIYPAHGFFFVCVKGKIKAKLIYSGHNGKGKTGVETIDPRDGSGSTKDPDGWDGVCKCFSDQRWDIQGSDIRLEWI